MATRIPSAPMPQSRASLPYFVGARRSVFLKGTPLLGITESRFNIRQERSIVCNLDCLSSQTSLKTIQKESIVFLFFYKGIEKS